MSKIRIIDLLNKIANGEEVPKEIKTNSNSYVFDENASCIENIYRTDNHMKTGWFNKEDFLLNDTVEIIEKEPEIDIQKLKGLNENADEIFNDKYGSLILENSLLQNRETINQLIKAVKQLDNQINNK